MDVSVLLVIAVLGVVLAGIAWLGYSMGTNEADVVTAWRTRYIMTGGLNIAVVSLGGVAIAAFTDDQELIVRLTTGLLLLITAGPLPWTLRSLRDERVFKTRKDVVGWVIGAALFRVLAVINLFVASIGLLIVTLVFVLLGGISVLLNLAAGVYPPSDTQDD